MKWISTKYPGVCYREHKSRRHGPRPDRYFAIRYYNAHGKRQMEALGWASMGWSPDKAATELGKIKENIKTGRGPQTLAEARELLKADREAAAASKAMLSLTVRQVAEKYKAWARANKKSWQDDVERLDCHILPVLGDMALSEVTLTDLETLQAVTAAKPSPRGGTLSPGTLLQVLGLARRLFNWAGERGMHPGPNPAKGLRLPKPDNGRVRFLSRDEADHLLAACKDQDLRDICELALYTGAREGELATLRWEDVDLSAGVLWLEGKTGRRKAYITDRLRPMLERRLKAGSQGLMFLNRRGRRILFLSHRFANVVARAGLNDYVTDPRQKVVFHTLRHTFASWLAQQGTPLLTIKELMGHQTMTMVMRYAHLAPNQARSAVEGL